MILSNSALALFAVLVASAALPGRAQVRDYRYEDLLRCPFSSLELQGLGPIDYLEPCILYNIEPAEVDNSTSVIPLVQVTPSNCGNHRDGAVPAIEAMNVEGVPIGFRGDQTIKFSMVSIVAGNPAALTAEEYERRHLQMLRAALEATGAPYIIGTCSFLAEKEKGPAEEYQAIIATQVGPPGFYRPENSNPYVFGFHINSDDYPLPNVQELDFLGDKSIPVRVVYRSQSEFFFSTCESALTRLQEEGFTDIKAILFDPSQDQDRDGKVNEFDVDFLQNLADEACPPDEDELQHPAIFLCTLTEQDVIIQRWLDTGCRPQSLWVTAATWNWADNNPEIRPYLQGGGQWHVNFDYSDRYYESGKALLDHTEKRFGYRGTYDQVVSYAIPTLFSRHLQSAYRVTDVPQPLADFADPAGRERLRRAMLVLTAETLFGPVAFNNHQRNIGRGAAGTQWLPENSDSEVYSNRLVSPFLQAEASTIIPAASALPCDAGSYANISAWAEAKTLLAGGCAMCPVDTFTKDPTSAFECNKCPRDSNTNDLVGSRFCYVYEDNLLSNGILAFGYVATSISWLLAFGFLFWIYRYRHDVMVKVSQPQFLILICTGAIISSSSVIMLGLDAGTDEDTSIATAGCMAVPFLYTIGWTLQFSSLSAKTFRLYQTMLSSKRMQRVNISATKTLSIVVLCLLVDLVIVTVWTIKSPLEYTRVEESRQIDEEAGIITISSVGRCTSADGSFWSYAGPILGFHLLLVIGTNMLLYKVRDVTDRYQEQKYVAMASALMLEILLVGIPVLVSVQDSVSATFIVLTAFVALDDIAVLCCIFFPKIRFQMKGVEEGVQVGETILRETHRRASHREISRRGGSSSFGGSTGEGTKSKEFAVAGIIVEEENSKDLASVSSQSEISVVKRLDNYAKRAQANQGRHAAWLPSSRYSANSSVLEESIVEETSADIQLELSSTDPSLGSRTKKSSESPSEETGLKKGEMGSSASSSTPGRPLEVSRSDNDSINRHLDSSATLLPSNVVSAAMASRQSSVGEHSTLSAETFSSHNPQQVFEEQMRMMEMTKKLMEEHEQMIAKTAQVMDEHKRLKDELEATKTEAGVCKRISKGDETPQTIDGNTDSSDETPAAARDTVEDC